MGAVNVVVFDWKTKMMGLSISPTSPVDCLTPKHVLAEIIKIGVAVCQIA